MRINRYIASQMAVNSFIHVFLILVAVTCVFPLLWMFGSSLKTQSTVFSDMSIIPRSMHWENFYLAWTKGGFGVYFRSPTSARGSSTLSASRSRGVHRHPTTLTVSVGDDPMRLPIATG